MSSKAKGPWGWESLAHTLISCFTIFTRYLQARWLRDSLPVNHVEYDRTVTFYPFLACLFTAHLYFPWRSVSMRACCGLQASETLKD